MKENVNVLVVEDRAVIRKTIMNSLSGLGCFFSEAESGEQALTLIEHTKFDVIFLDLKLSGISGIETFKRAKIIRSDLPPVIILTGSMEPNFQEEAKQLGIFKYLIKNPLDQDVLRQVIISIRKMEY
jgi:CheY-like chemotaxis protein